MVVGFHGDIRIRSLPHSPHVLIGMRTFPIITGFFDAANPHLIGPERSIA
jgi:hypothetical protein